MENVCLILLIHLILHFGSTVNRSQSIYICSINKQSVYKWVYLTNYPYNDFSVFVDITSFCQGILIKENVSSAFQ